MLTLNNCNCQLICLFIGIIFGYNSLVATAQQYRSYTLNQKYQNQNPRLQPQENPYRNRNQQGQLYNKNNYNNYNNNNNINNIIRHPNNRNGQYDPPALPYNASWDSSANKCVIYVPVELVDKYPMIKSLGNDEQNKEKKIEICCKGFGVFRSQSSSITYCRPVCDNCQNGICIAPNECQCHEEFVKNDNGDCVFTCPMGCLNGQCYLDGTCQCDPGYKLDETRKFCRPICTGGCGANELHNCTEPEVCGCIKNYQLTDQGCEPTCNPECGIGGKCIGVNECECNAGFMLKDGVCQEECYQKCDNGICYARNRCICNPGFTYHERSTRCVPV